MALKKVYSSSILLQAHLTDIIRMVSPIKNSKSAGEDGVDALCAESMWSENSSDDEYQPAIESGTEETEEEDEDDDSNYDDEKKDNVEEGDEISGDDMEEEMVMGLPLVEGGASANEIEDTKMECAAEAERLVKDMKCKNDNMELVKNNTRVIDGGNGGCAFEEVPYTPGNTFSNHDISVPSPSASTAVLSITDDVSPSSVATTKCNSRSQSPRHSPLPSSLPARSSEPSISYDFLSHGNAAFLASLSDVTPLHRGPSCSSSTPSTTLHSEVCAVISVLLFFFVLICVFVVYERVCAIIKVQCICMVYVSRKELLLRGPDPSSH